MVKTIRLLALDIDGVLTDGTTRIAADGTESKGLCFRDLDAMTQAGQMGLAVVLVTGESGPLVEVIARRFGVKEVMSGAKDKAAALREIASRHQIRLAEICYVGDSDRDAPAVGLAGLGLVPADATPKAKKSAHGVLETPGGKGVLAEIMTLLAGRIGSFGETILRPAPSPSEPTPLPAAEERGAGSGGG